MRKRVSIVASLFFIVALLGIGVFCYGKNMKDVHIIQGKTEGIYNLEEKSFSGTITWGGVIMDVEWSGNNIISNTPASFRELAGNIEELAIKKRNTFINAGLILAVVCFFISILLFIKGRHTEKY